MPEPDCGPLARSLPRTTRDIPRPLIGACGRFWWVAKPLIEAKGRAQREATEGRPTKLSPNSDAVSEPEKIRTDTELAKIAGVGKDTVRKVEKIKETAAPELLTAAVFSKLSGQPDGLHDKVYHLAAIHSLPPACWPTLGGTKSEPVSAPTLADIGIDKTRSRHRGYMAAT